MTQRLRKFIARAPRYVLRADDLQFLRFAPEENADNIYSTRFINVSETGLAFLVERDLVPNLGDVIKIEFPVPNSDTIAWFARVIRMEEYERGGWRPRHRRSDEILVGVRFLDLPEGHRKHIRKGLEEKFLEALKQNRKESLKSFLSYIFNTYSKLIFYAVCALATFALLYYLAQPSDNYDAKRGAPWGERFK